MLKPRAVNGRRTPRILRGSKDHNHISLANRHFGCGSHNTRAGNSQKQNERPRHRQQKQWAGPQPRRFFRNQRMSGGYHLRSSSQNAISYRQITIAGLRSPDYDRASTISLVATAPSRKIAHVPSSLKNTIVDAIVRGEGPPSTTSP